MNRSPSALELRGVGVQFGADAALADVSLAVAAGETLGIVGPSGAGKTTLLRVLGGGHRPQQGEVRIGGEDPYAGESSGQRRLRSTIGFVHQDLALVPNLRVDQNVLAGRLGRLGLWGALRRAVWPRAPELEEIHAILERVGIGAKIFQRTDRLSGGEQQRVAIARALYQEPRALLADEPVASVDPARARDTLALLRDLSLERGIPLVCSLHQQDLAQSTLSRLIGLREGQCVFDRSAEEVTSEEWSSLYRLADAPRAGP